MTREELIRTASQLKQPDSENAAAFDAAKDQIAAELNKRMGARPDLEKLVGAQGQAMMEDNSRNFCRFMASNFTHYQPEVFVTTVLWVFRTYRSHGFQVAFWPANIDTSLEIVRGTLSEASFSEVKPFYEWLVVNIPVFTAISDQELDAT